MCEITEIGSSSFLNCERGCKHPSGGDAGINIAENELNSAQQSFTDHVIDSTACINSLTLKLGQLRRQAPNFQDVVANNYCLPENKTGTIDKLETEKLQTKLHKSVLHSSLSIKRSLMKLSNLLAQHHILNLPYYELKAYSKQIVSHQNRDECVHFRPSSERLSYSEALQNLKQMLEDVESVEKKTLCRIEKSQRSKYMVNDSHHSINDEYKCLSQSLALEASLGEFVFD